MGLYLDDSALQQIHTQTVNELNSIKEQWSDDDQRQFYDDKVNELDSFTKKTISQFTQIDDEFYNIMRELEKVQG